MEKEIQLQEAVDEVINTLPGVWNNIRAKLRSAATSNFGITLEQFHILRHIRRGYASVAELADVKQISRPAVSQAVQSLVEKGLVTRQTDTEDRRSARLALTPYAEKVLDANYDSTREWMKGKMQTISSDEAEQVIRAMEILKKFFNSEEK
jgi:DNA-binding MarR family transcriptional regulator